MSAAEKVGLVKDARAEFGLSACLRVLGLARSTWHYQARRQRYSEKHRHLRRPLEEIARKHPEYGYRRTTTELREAYDEHVNHKVVQRLHQLWELPLVRSTRPPAPSKVRQVLIEVGPRANLVAQLPMEIGPFNVAYTDFTELVYATGKAHLIPILDHTTKLVLGWKLGPRALTALALAAWKMAKATLQELGRTPAGMILHHDRDPVFTSYGWTSQILLRDKARLSYALEGARDNTEMESFNSRFKNENRSLLVEARDLVELETVVTERMVYYNRERRHSALGNQAPMAYVRALQTPRG
jgi:transposase InsO family protein